MTERKAGPGFSIFVLQLLALPVTLVLGARKLFRILRGYRLASQGDIECPHCGFSNAVNVLATCPECGSTEFGSRLYCTSCRTVSEGFDCGRCLATIRVFPR